MAALDIEQLINHPEKLNGETLYEIRTLLNRYPFFQSLRLLYLKNLYLMHDNSFGAELRKSIFFISDRTSLYYLIEGEKSMEPVEHDGSSADVSMQAGKEDRTLALINAFLQDVPEEANEQTSVPDYSMDYTSYLLAQENTPQPIERKITLDPTREVLSTPDISEDDNYDMDDSYFTETLAKIYIKQQRYEKALEIIKRLDLKYPKKSAYFADQIRFLEKLIINAKTK